MHRVIFITAALLASSIISYGQRTVAITPTKMNVFYIGIENPVSITVSDAADDKVTVSLSGGGGTITRARADLYHVRVSTVTDECLINVYVNGALAGTSKFRVSSLPAPTPSVGGYDSGATIPANAFRVQAGVGSFIKDFPFEVKYVVTGFTIHVGDKKGSLVSADCQGAVFSKVARNHINQHVKPGRLVTIENIRAKDSGGVEHNLPSLVYYIK